MLSLFPSTSEPEDDPQIPGLRYFRDYVTAEEEAALVEAIDREPWDTTWSRRRQPYGATYGPGKAEPRPIPAWADVLRKRLVGDNVGDFDQLLVNEYLPGQGIAMHHDYQAFDRTVVSLSLLSDCVMDFAHPQHGKTHHLLERRSLLVLQDAARYEWQHGIAARQRDHWRGVSVLRRRRLSVTLRRLKSG